MYALYIDDSRLGAPNRHELDEAIAAIKDAKLQITLEGDLADFLGVKIERKSPNEIRFTQPHLIDDTDSATRRMEKRPPQRRAGF